MLLIGQRSEFQNCRIGSISVDVRNHAYHNILQYLKLSFMVQAFYFRYLHSPVPSVSKWYRMVLMDSI